ncbi:MAG: glycerol acyltransferase [Bacteroidales bacterium]|nr:glycerol acyltransferase [Bacteroidales bacterium]
MAKVIDMEAVVASRIGGKRPSKLLVAILEKYLRVDFLNSLFDDDKRGVDCLNGIIGRLGVTFPVKGLDDVPNDGRRYVFASNHPLGGIDGLIESALIASRFPDSPFRCQVNDFLMSLSPLSDLFIPISKTGAQSRDLPQLLDSHYAGDEQILVFPAGLCSRRIDGLVRDLPWKKTFVQKGVPNGRWIVPVFFKGRNSSRFYRVAALCARLGLKFNLAMTLLPDEVYRGRGKHYEVIFGKPIPPSYFDDSKTPEQWAAWLRDEVYRMGAAGPEGGRIRTLI